MKTYKISPREGEDRRPFFVDAESHSDAAQLGLKRMHTGPGKFAAVRVSGDHEKSGLFQGYTTGNPQNSVGYQFHVMEV